MVGGIVPGLHLGQINLIGVLAAAALFPDQFPLRQGTERGSDPFLTDVQFFRQGQAWKGHKDLAVVVDPAFPAGELKAVEEEGVSNIGVQIHVRVPGGGKQPARHLHIVRVLDVGLLHQQETGVFFYFGRPHGGTRKCALLRSVRAARCSPSQKCKHF